eukprot:gene5007-6993_t
MNLNQPLFLQFDSIPDYVFQDKDFTVQVSIKPHAPPNCLMEQLRMNVKINDEDDVDGINNNEYYPDLIQTKGIEMKTVNDVTVALVTVSLKSLSITVMNGKIKRRKYLIYAEVIDLVHDLIKGTSRPITVVRQQLKIIENEVGPSYAWYKDEGGKDKSIELTIYLMDSNGNIVIDRHVPFTIKLIYQGGQIVQQQDILVLSPDSTKNIEIGSGCARLKLRINEVSTRHRGQLFQILLTPDTNILTNLADIGPASSIPVEVKSKRNSTNKSKIAELTGGTVAGGPLIKKIRHDIPYNSEMGNRSFIDNQTGFNVHPITNTQSNNDMYQALIPTTQLSIDQYNSAMKNPSYNMVNRSNLPPVLPIPMIAKNISIDSAYQNERKYLIYMAEKLEQLKWTNPITIIHNPNDIIDDLLTRYNQLQPSFDVLSNHFKSSGDGVNTMPEAFPPPSTNPSFMDIDLNLNHGFSNVLSNLPSLTNSTTHSLLASFSNQTTNSSVISSAITSSSKQEIEKVEKIFAKKVQDIGMPALDANNELIGFISIDLTFKPIKNISKINNNKQAKDDIMCILLDYNEDQVFTVWSEAVNDVYCTLNTKKHHNDIIITIPAFNEWDQLIGFYSTSVDYSANLNDSSPVIFYSITSAHYSDDKFIINIQSKLSDIRKNIRINGHLDDNLYVIRKSDKDSPNKSAIEDAIAATMIPNL